MFCKDVHHQYLASYTILDGGLEHRHNGGQSPVCYYRDDKPFSFLYTHY